MDDGTRESGVSERWRTMAISSAFVVLYRIDWHKLLKIKDSDGGGFEPPVPFGTHAFQACTINHSVTHPSCGPHGEATRNTTAKTARRKRDIATSPARFRK